jgi:hypothetical protein
MGKKKLAKEVATLKAEVADLKKEMANLGKGQTAKLMSEIDNLNKKLHAELEQIKQGSKREEKEVKVQALGKKAAKAKGEAKAAIEARTTKIQNKSKESTTSSEQQQEAKNKGEQKI